MKDFLLNEAGDIAIQNGDFAIGDATADNAVLRLISNKGDWKQFPEVGAGFIYKIKNAKTPPEITNIQNDALAELRAEGITAEFSGDNDFKINII